MSSDRVLVIGGTRGTGLLIARRLAQTGVAVRALARDPARATVALGSAAEVVAGDITHPETLPPAIEQVHHIVFTAGRRSNRPAREEDVRDTEYQGVVNTLNAARAVGFGGRFMYMTAIGAGRRSIAAAFLNLFKGNTLHWRERAEGEIRTAGVDYTIIRCGVLVDAPAGEHVITLSQKPLPLSLRYRIARGDVAEAFVAALNHPRASRAAFEIVWGDRGRPEPWAQMLDRLQPDVAR
ncbi:MAG TPA: SDR family oxidoreductase [Gemmatimonadaceae bacterium]